jgi:two-component system CheB/CheR fusion protein
MEQALADARATLEVHAANLEQGIRERTAQLAAANEAMLKEMEDCKRLEREILVSVELERQRLGRELHDGLSQLLTAAKFKLGWMRRELERQMPVEAAEVAGLEDEINRALEQARDMAHGLNPASLVARGLVAALEDLARGVARTFQMDCVCQCPHPMHIRDQDVALHLYRIAQEAVQNAVQHGRARRIVIALTEGEGCGRLDILDDGVGFCPGTLPAGMGLRNMEARAKAIGGRLAVRPRSGGGTLVNCLWSATLGVVLDPCALEV